jgi:hypothetical protein
LIDCACRNFDFSFYGLNSSFTDCFVSQFGPITVPFLIKFAFAGVYAVLPITIAAIMPIAIVEIILAAATTAAVITAGSLLEIEILVGQQGHLF